MSSRKAQVSLDGIYGGINFEFVNLFQLYNLDDWAKKLYVLNARNEWLLVPILIFGK